jgi:HK97 family phage prohead protease
MMNNRRFQMPLDIKALDDSTGEFTGYGAVFGNRDSYGDVIVKGAFKNFLATNEASKVKLLWQHETDKPIGVYLSLSEDENGLVAKGKLLINEVAQAREAYALLKAGAISGLSIGYSINPDGARMGQDGIYYLSDLKIWEISIVTFPANPLANVDSIKAIENIRDFEKFLRDVGGFSIQKAKAIAAEGFKAVSGQRDVDSHEAAEALLQSIKNLTNTIKGV